MKKGFRIHHSDNVATLLADTTEEDVESIGAILGAILENRIHCREPISFGHKIAVGDIALNSSVVKYGVVIGTATRPIRAGEWVHLHNCRSQLDERSATLDRHTGSAQDVKYE